MNKRFGLYFDFETTGLRAGQAEPIELAAILYDLETLEEVSRFETGLMVINRPQYVSEKALEVNGYTMEEIMEGRNPMMAFMEFVGWLERQVGAVRVHLSGHNAAFDIDFLKQAFRDYLPQLVYENLFEVAIIDTKTIAAESELNIPVYEGKRTRNTLENLTTHFGVQHIAHKAMGDVEAGLEVLRKFKAAGEIKIMFSTPRNHYAMA